MKITIKNRKNQNVVVVVDKAENQKGLVFLMHGHGKTKHQEIIESFARVFADNNYSVVRFDATHSFGESDGKFEDSTVTGYYGDLEDVIKWAKSQEFYQEPFVLAGTSVGSMCIVLYSQKYPTDVKCLIPASAVISGKLSSELEDKKKLAEWREKTYKTWNSVSEPGVVKTIKYGYFEDKMKHDLLKDADKLIMPVLLIVGDKDNVTPLEHQKLFFDKLSGKKEFHIVKGATHNLHEENHLNEVKSIVDQWIKGLD